MEEPPSTQHLALTLPLSLLSSESHLLSHLSNASGSKSRPDTCLVLQISVLGQCLAPKCQRWDGFCHSYARPVFRPHEQGGGAVTARDTTPRCCGAEPSSEGQEGAGRPSGRASTVHRDAQGGGLRGQRSLLTSPPLPGTSGRSPAEAPPHPAPRGAHGLPGRRQGCGYLSGRVVVLAVLRAPHPVQRVQGGLRQRLGFSACPSALQVHILIRILLGQIPCRGGRSEGREGGDTHTHKQAAFLGARESAASAWPFSS